MQTFLPYPSFTYSARVLDTSRLGKQRVETKQILRALLGETKGWQNHPATKMWRGHEGSLATYGYLMCLEWIERGHNDTLLPYFAAQIAGRDLTKPDWLGYHAFHASHRSNLLRKDPEWYGQYGWTETDDLPYVWPTNA